MSADDLRQELAGEIALRARDDAPPSHLQSVHSPASSAVMPNAADAAAERDRAARDAGRGFTNW
jgi:hypothetical protein